MTIFRKDKRHLGDLLARTQVQLEVTKIQVAYLILKENCIRLKEVIMMTSFFYCSKYCTIE